ncbi:hypothetical protein M4914_12460 [Streptomyces somaliensis DSM 40738]|uniref:hypothetical protein n=1 Tax=Streptomyces somaliensis TaxID=78355 RepID=UPI0021C41919|nr:hypothetical protein [Streptomyces somaliensis]MCQ0023679.1 hypothetical protein [Streptomyces somaliensis DSM 40738]
MNHHRASVHSPSPKNARGSPKTTMPGRYGLYSDNWSGAGKQGAPVRSSSAAASSTTRTSDWVRAVPSSRSGTTVAPRAATAPGSHRGRCGRYAASSAAIP